MATDQTPDPLPGDVIQITDIEHWGHSHLGLIMEVRRWGAGVVVRCPGDQGGPDKETYVRLSREKFVVIGPAAIIPGELASARRDAIETAAAVAREAQS